MTDFDLANIRRIKKRMAIDENYWDQSLSVDFCIARRTRDILLGRSIADNFIRTKKRVLFEYEINKFLKEYFLEYVRDPMAIADFLSIIFEPNQQFASEFKKLDARLYPLIVSEQNSPDWSEETKSEFVELLDLFRRNRNTNFWKDHEDWDWFTSQFFAYFEELPEQVCKDGINFFLQVTVPMHENLIKSGWKIDYELYDDPLSAWGGSQGLISKSKTWLRTKKFRRHVKQNLPYKKNTARSFWELAILTTLMFALFPWSLLFCVIFFGIEDTKDIVFSIFGDIVRAFFGVVSIAFAIAIFLVGAVFIWNYPLEIFKFAGFYLIYLLLIVFLGTKLTLIPYQPLIDEEPLSQNSDKNWVWDKPQWVKLFHLVIFNLVGIAYAYWLF